jgi:hypothetical protein
LQRSSGSSTIKTPNTSSQSQANYTSDSSRWYDRLEYPPQGASDNVSVNELGIRETTKVHCEECVDVGASNLTNGSSVSALEDVVKKNEELQLAEETNYPPKNGMIDCAYPSVSHESPNLSRGLAKPAEQSDHVKGPPKAEPVGVLSNSSVKFGNFDEVPGIALPSDAFTVSNSSIKYMDDEDATQLRNESRGESELEDEMNSKKNVDTSPTIIHAVEASTENKRNPLDICEIPDSPADVSCSTTLTDPVSLSSSNNDLEVPVTSSSVASTESQTLVHDHAMVSVGFGGEISESKERFRQRLWCFLFENLNRAVDELYLLCELECDMEQINESMLVLDEAISDFQELKSRAEHFDNTKKSPGLPKEGMPMAVKADHRRPHSLSWEVRVLGSLSIYPFAVHFHTTPTLFCLQNFVICVYGCFLAFLISFLIVFSKILLLEHRSTMLQ